MKSLQKIVIGCLVLLLFACSGTGKKALEKGRYYDAVKQSVDKLRKDANNKDAPSVLKTAYKRASEDYLRNIDRAKAANQPFKYERVLESYEKLNSMHEMIELCTACRAIVNPGSYYVEMEEARNMAASERYNLALALMDKKTIPAGRDAYNHLIEVQKFAPGYMDVDQKVEEALFVGSYHVVLEQPAINSRLFQYSNEYFQDRIEEYLQTNRRLNKFIRFYNPAEAEQIKLKPDHIVRLEFIDFVVGQTLIQSDTKELTSKDSVVIGTIKAEGKDINVYGQVKAKFTQNRKTVKSTGILLMVIEDFQTSRILQRSELPGEFIWVNEWAHYNGDERALTKPQVVMSTKREEIPPMPQQLFIEFCKPIYNQFTSRIKTFYDKY